MRIYGSFMWNLSKLVDTVDMPRVYVGTLGGDFDYDNKSFTNLFNNEQIELLTEIKNLPKTALLRKITNFIRRAHLAIVTWTKILIILDWERVSEWMNDEYLNID